MRISTLIMSLQANLKCYGDLEVWLRIYHMDEEIQAKLEGRVIKTITGDGVLLMGSVKPLDGVMP